MRLIPEKLRWRIAYWIDKHTDQCWSDLVGWVMADSPREGNGRPPFSSASCQAEVATIGGCYCGKFRADREPVARVDTGTPGDTDGGT